MADKKISALVSLAGKDVAATDFFPVVDVSVTETKSLTRDELRNAVNAIQFTATKALATTAAASLPDDTIIEVAADESLAGARTRYKVAAGALVFSYGVVTKADLADASDPAKGAALVGYDGGDVQDVLDDAKPMASYAALRAYTGRATGVRVTSLGVAGLFQRDASDTTSADNGGTIIVDAAGRRWKRLFDGAVSIRWFGAVGDGVSDDTAALQTAVDSGHSLFWPEAPAGYLVTDTVTVKRRQSWVGAGPFKSYIRNATPSGSVAILFTETGTPDTFPSLRYNDFSNIGVIGGLPGTAAIGNNPNCGDGVKFEAASWLRFENFAVFGNKCGIAFGDSSIALRFDRCIIKANREDGVYDQVHATSALENVDVSFVETNIEQSVRGAVVNSGKMRFSGCTIEANSGSDIEANKTVTVVDCYIEKTTGGTSGSPVKMLQMASAAYGSQIHGNRFLMGATDYLYAIDYANHCTVGGNAFYNVDTANGSRPINFSGSGITNSIFVGNIDLGGSNFGIDTPVLVNQSEIKSTQSQYGSVLFDNVPVAATNALDYYQEGEFTPTAIGTTTAGVGTYTYNSGRYTRIGNRVFFELSIFWTAHTGTGNIRLGGLPFSSKSAAVPISAVSLSFSSLIMTAGRQAVGSIIPNSTQIDIQQVDISGVAAATGIPLENSNVIIFCSGSYAV